MIAEPLVVDPPALFAAAVFAGCAVDARVQLAIDPNLRACAACVSSPGLCEPAK